MEHNNPPHRWQRNDQDSFIGIDRERSLRAVELAERSLGKNRSARSYSKYRQ
jgi:hypothetical protein